jgi:hypothetical protein
MQVNNLPDFLVQLIELVSRHYFVERGIEVWIGILGAECVNAIALRESRLMGPFNRLSLLEGS